MSNGGNILKTLTFTSMTDKMIVTRLLLQVLAALVFITLYLFMDAKEDQQNAEEYGGFSHRNNASVRITALSGILLFCTLFALGLISFSSWTKTTASIFLLGLFWGWLFFDMIYNQRNNQKFSHVGSGGIDKFFKDTFKDRAFTVMLTTKLIGITLALIWITFNLSRI